MKLRIKGNSLRLRVARSELSRLVEGGRIEETIQFAADKGATLTYAVECSSELQEVSLRFTPRDITVAIPLDASRQWASSDQVGIGRDMDIGDRVLSILIEKDFACLDGTEAENEDTFPNPNQGKSC